MFQRFQVNFRDYVLCLVPSPFYSRERLHFNAKLNCKNLHMNVEMFCLLFIAQKAEDLC